MSEKCKVLAIEANFCKLFCDPSKPMINKDLIPQFYKTIDID